MDNVVFETQTIPGFFDVTDIVPSKRLKIKPKSKENIENKIIKFRSIAINDSANDMKDDTENEVKEVTPVSNDINVSVVGSGNLVLDNIQKDDIVSYLQVFPIISKKPIRLNDSMYGNFKGKSLDSSRNPVINMIDSSTADVFQSVPTENVSIPSGVSVSPIIDTASVDTEQVKDAIDDAFSSEFKKVGSSNTKAQIDKYVNDLPSMELSPTVGHINDSIFASDNSEVADNAVVDVETVSERDVPIVVAERSDAPVAENKRFVFEQSGESEKDNSDNSISSIDMQSEDNYLNELKKYEESFKDSESVSDEFVGADIISFEEAKVNIEKAREASKKLDEQTKKEQEKLEKAVNQCNEALAEYRDVCEQVKSYIVSYQEANRAKEEQLDQLVAEREAQEKRTATYVRQSDEIVALMSSPQDDANYVKRRVA